MSQQTDSETIRCVDRCGRSVHIDDVDKGGWVHLEIQKRYRCTTCWRELKTTNERYNAQDKEAPQ